MVTPSVEHLRQALGLQVHSIQIDHIEQCSESEVSEHRDGVGRIHHMSHHDTASRFASHETLRPIATGSVCDDRNRP
jgi:hypothetical protein